MEKDSSTNMYLLDYDIDNNQIETQVDGLNNCVNPLKTIKDQRFLAFDTYLLSPKILIILQGISCGL